MNKLQNLIKNPLLNAIIAGLLSAFLFNLILKIPFAKIMQQGLTHLVLYFISILLFGINIYLLTKLIFKPKQVFVLLSASITKPFMANLLNDLLTEFYSNNFVAIVMFPEIDFNLSEQKNQLEKILTDKWHYKGGIFLPGGDCENITEINNFARSFKKPIIFIDNQIIKKKLPKLKNVSYVGFDNELGGSLAFNAINFELREKNIKSPKVLVIGANFQTERQKKFEELLYSNFKDIKIHSTNESEFSREKAYKIAIQYFQKIKSKKEEVYDAIFCTNDDTAIGVAKALKEHFPEIKDEIILIGYDGSNEAIELINSKENVIFKNTIIQSTKKFSKEINMQLVKMIKKEKFEKNIIIEPTLLNPIPRNQ